MLCPLEAFGSLIDVKSIGFAFYPAKSQNYNSGFLHGLFLGSLGSLQIVQEGAFERPLKGFRGLYGSGVKQTAE